MASVELLHVRKTYNNGATAVDDFSLLVNDKEFLVLVGPSGCGKSTTLRMIAGLEEISSGEIKIGGASVSHLPPKDRDIAMVFQNYALYPHKTVYENMAFGLKLRHTPKTEIQQRVMEAASVLGLTDYLKRLPKQLSGGQRQRVALGRAIVRKPKVFLFDEPLSNLDAKMRVEMREEILRLHRHLQATIIYVTHDQIEAMTMGDRIVVMNEGKIRQVADPLTLYTKPADCFTAGFIGTPPMNFLSLTRNGNLLENDAGSIPLTDEWRGAIETHEKVIFGIRPENLFGNNDELFNGFSAKVDLIEQMGSESFVHLTVSNVRLTARVRPDWKHKEGDEITFKPDLTKAHIFDQNSGECLI